MSVAAATNALITLDRLKSEIGDTDLGDPEQYIINRVSGLFDAFVGYQIVQATYTNEVYDGTGTNKLPLRQYNCSDLSKVEYRTSIGIATPTWAELTLGWFFIDTAKFAVQSEVMKFINIPSYYRVSYKAGWATPPESIIDVFVEECRVRLQKRYGVQSQNQGGQSSSGTSYRDISPDTKYVLRSYQKIRL